jgi:hypothetical protein
MSDDFDIIYKVTIIPQSNELYDNINEFLNQHYEVKYDKAINGFKLELAAIDFKKGDKIVRYKLHILEPDMVNNASYEGLVQKYSRGSKMILLIGDSNSGSKIDELVNKLIEKKPKGISVFGDLGTLFSLIETDS